MFEFIVSSSDTAGNTNLNTLPEPGVSSLPALSFAFDLTLYQVLFFQVTVDESQVQDSRPLASCQIGVPPVSVQVEPSQKKFVPSLFIVTQTLVSTPGESSEAVPEIWSTVS